MELGEYGREQVLFDVEFKVEESGELAVKQVRPFLVTQPPPETRTFWLEVPGGTELCGAWIEGRSPLEEHAVKSRMRLAPGRHELPTAVDVFFGGNIIEEVLFGEERELLEPESAGLYRVDTRADAGGEVQSTRESHSAWWRAVDIRPPPPSPRLPARRLRRIATRPRGPAAGSEA